MRPELEIIEKIEAYLQSNLSSEDRVAFEKQLAADPGLREDLKLQQQLMRAVERSAIKEKIQVARKNFYHGKNFFKWGIGGLSAIVAFTAAFMVYKNIYSNKEYHLPELNEKGEKQWVDADKNLPAQTFTIDGSTDTVIETKAGIVMAIPSNSFVDAQGKAASGKIDLVIKEALDPASILKAGLSTKAGDQLLESGGMFYLDGRKNGDILRISKSIHAEIPTAQIKPGMQLFTGKRTPDGKIDWVDPKPLVHDLTPVDISSLGFYPDGYLDSLKQWGRDITNREFTDSLYYSFASLFDQATPAPFIDKIKLDTMYPEAARPLIFKGDSTIGRDVAAPPISGKVLFQSKCQSCHRVLGDGVGPKLGGVLNNDYYQGDLDKVMKWLVHTNSMVNSVPHYEQLKWQFGSIMMQFAPGTIDQQELKAIFDYIEDVYQSGVEDFYGIPCGINPAKIKTIRTDQFQNTLLATREFEERMYWIHRFRDPNVLDIYVNNLDKDMWVIDSMAAAIFHPGSEAFNLFMEFAARHDGKVKNGDRQAEMLKKYYSNKTKAYTDAISKTQSEFWSKQDELDNEATGKQYQHEDDSLDRRNSNFDRELAVNLKDAYRQLGYSEYIPPPTGTGYGYYSVDVAVTGWCNVDRYVFESTTNRTTLDYTDPNTGKKAVIKYQAVSFQINNWNDYDRLYVYLLPDSLNSFMQMDGNNGFYSEKLNELMKYDVVYVAYKGDRSFFYSRKNIQPQEYRDIVLNEISPQDLDQQLNSIGNRDQARELKKENDFHKFEIADLKRQKQNIALKQLAGRLRNFLFVCAAAAKQAVATR